MWVESPRFFTEKVEITVNIYNHTPRSREVGSPISLWHAPKETWEYLVKGQKEERQRANWRYRHRRIQGNLDVGQKGWIWNTKTVTLKDKLEPWWEGPAILEDRISQSVWKVRGPDGRVWTRHADMLRPYRGQEGG